MMNSMYIEKKLNTIF